MRSSNMKQGNLPLSPTSLAAPGETSPIPGKTRRGFIPKTLTRRTNSPQSRVFPTLDLPATRAEGEITTLALKARIAHIAPLQREFFFLFAICPSLSGTQKHHQLVQLPQAPERQEQRTRWCSNVPLFAFMKTLIIPLHCIESCALALSLALLH